jgi:quercetin dioxygenase-like cupin family protein
MPNKSRRELCLALPALAFLSSAIAETQAQTATTSSLAHSRTFSFDELPSSKGPTGNIAHPVLRGTLPTGETLEMHETTLMPGQMPHPAHKHVHSEFMLIREGTLEFTANDKPQQIGPGGIAYAASNEVHSLKNIGSSPANYFVIAIGAEMAKG